MTRPNRWRTGAVLAALGVVGVTACSSAGVPAPTVAADVPKAPHVEVAALEPGERWIDLGLPGGSYTPQAEAGGTDDYRCLLLDPGLAEDVFLSGVVLEPGNPAIVHHAILYRVDPDQVAQAEAQDAADPHQGWSCFGGPGIRDERSSLNGLDAAPWLAAFATTGGEQRFRAGTGTQVAAGSRIVLQMHYNLLRGGGTDSSVVRLRVAPSGADLRPLHTLLLPAPVELPCPSGQTGALCNRQNAVLDVMHRFGGQAGATVAGLQLLCGGAPTAPRAGPTQTCSRPVTSTMRVVSVAGHMHLLGRAIRVDLDRADGTTRTLLDVTTFDFDNQAAHRLARPVTVRPGDRLRVTCTHDAGLRERLPELQGLPPRYVVWGEGSSDEMCLGIVSYVDGG